MDAAHDTPLPGVPEATDPVAINPRRYHTRPRRSCTASIDVQRDASGAASQAAISMPLVVHHRLARDDAIMSSTDGSSSLILQREDERQQEMQRGAHRDTPNQPSFGLQGSSLWRALLDCGVAAPNSLRVGHAAATMLNSRMAARSPAFRSLPENPDPRDSGSHGRMGQQNQHFRVFKAAFLDFPFPIFCFQYIAI